MKKMGYGIYVTWEQKQGCLWEARNKPLWWRGGHGWVVGEGIDLKESAVTDI